jgi:hypothetical protein
MRILEKKKLTGDHPIDRRFNLKDVADLMSGKHHDDDFFDDEEMMELN